MDFVEFAGEFINKRYIASILRVDAPISFSKSFLYYLKAIIVINEKTIHLEMSFENESQREEKLKEMIKSSLSLEGIDIDSVSNLEEIYIGAYL